MSDAETSYDVRIWSLEKRRRAKGTVHGVRWSVAGRPRRRAFATAKLADSFRAELLTASRAGSAFDVATGMPHRPGDQRSTVTWFNHARQYAETKWPLVSPNHRRGIAETLVDATLELTNDAAQSPFGDASLRRVLRSHAFVPQSVVASDDGRALAWLAEHSRPVADLALPAVTRRVLDRLARRIDGSPAAASTLARKRAVFHNALDAAVDAGHLAANPMAQVRSPRRAGTTFVDARSVVNPDQAAALIEAVRKDSPSLEAFFACIYYGGTRPAEALALTRQQLQLPDAGWGELELTGSQQATARVWTDGAGTRQDRPLKHRQRGTIRYAPAPPELVEILHRHLDSFACGIRGHLFVARTGRAGTPLSPPYEVTVGMNTIYRAWDRARRAAMTDAEYRSPLARRPYDLRHAYVSTWLGAGVSPADIAGQAGQSTRVMLQVYSHSLEGRQQSNREAVERMLRPDARPSGDRGPDESEATDR